MMGATMSDIRLSLDTRRESGDPTPPYAVVNDDAIRAIVERAQRLGLIPIPEIKIDAPPFDKPAAPADDDAIAQRIVTFLKEGWPTGTPALVRNLVAAIRRGEVPGLTTTDKLAAAHASRDASAEGYRDTIKEIAAERDTLKAEVERLRVELNRCVGPLVPKEKLDAAIARAEKAEKFEAVCHCGSPVSTHDPMNDGHGPVEMSEPCPFEQERDAARAAHAEAIELLHQTQECSEGIHFGSDLADAIDAHLAKYGKDASK